MKNLFIIIMIFFAAALVCGQEENDFDIQSNGDGTVTILKYNGDEKNVTIPPEILSSKVTKIHDKAFYNMRLTGANIPDGITHIGINAFRYNNIKEISIPDSVNHIGAGAFSSNELVKVTLPGGIKYIGSDTFSNNKLESITIPEGVLVIGAMAFSRNRLNTIIIPSAIVYIGTKAFESNPIKDIKLGEGVSSIAGGAFYFNVSDFSITNITIMIGQDVEISNADSGRDTINAFPLRFDQYYNQSRRAKGKYVYNNKVWRYYADTE